ncbi:hypothetical protein R2362_03260 [Mycobacteroides chelonae]|nr:hypothetical protein [Mycobacteroides chelonae]
MSDDAPEDWSPVGIEKAIYTAVQRIAKGVIVCSKAHEDFLKADRDHDTGYAIAFLNNEGSIEARKYQARIDTEGLREARDRADVVYQRARQNMRALESELEALRSIGVSVRQAYQNAGRGEY